jgi:TRAP-type C4-dicarboxylate transport system substrate-binding protein
MSPEDRQATEALISGKPRLTITKESLAIWNSLTPDEQAAQLAVMTPEQQEAIQLAAAGERAPL